MKTNQNICYNCFCEKTWQGSKCSKCGYDESADKDKYPLALPHGHIIHDKYLLKYRKIFANAVVGEARSSDFYKSE